MREENVNVRMLQPPERLGGEEDQISPESQIKKVKPKYDTDHSEETDTEIDKRVSKSGKYSQIIQKHRERKWRK